MTVVETGLAAYGETFSEINEWIEAHEGSKFEPEDVSGAWADGLEEYVRQYTGTFEYLTKLKADLADPIKYLSRGQLKGVANCYRADYLRAKKQKASGAKVVDMRERPASVEPVVPNGMYTVVFPGDIHYTLRLKSVTGQIKQNFPEGTQAAEFLAGPDNEGDYIGFAFVVGAERLVWKKFRDDTLLTTSLEILLKADFEARLSFGEAYAIASGNCARCGRTLTVPVSVGRGYGPICFGIIMGEELEGEWEE